MKKNYILLLLVITYSKTGFTQTDPGKQEKTTSVFNTITKAVQAYKPDTSAAPDDKITRKIIALRNLKGGFNINEAIDFKMEEERQKNDLTPNDFALLSTFFKTGHGKRWLDNAIIHIYRDNFTYKELKQLIKFYNTSVGQKMATNFPVIMLQSLAVAQMIKDNFTKRQQRVQNKSVN